MKKGVPEDEVFIHGMFGCAIKHKPLMEGHVKTEAYIDNQRRQDARFCAKGFRGP